MTEHFSYLMCLCSLLSVCFCEMAAPLPRGISLNVSFKSLLLVSEWRALVFLHGALWVVSVNMNHGLKPIFLLSPQLSCYCMICMFA